MGRPEIYKREFFDTLPVEFEVIPAEGETAQAACIKERATLHNAATRHKIKINIRSGDNYTRLSVELRKPTLAEALKEIPGEIRKDAAEQEKSMA